MQEDTLLRRGVLVRMHGVLRCLFFVEDRLPLYLF